MHTALEEMHKQLLEYALANKGDTPTCIRAGGRAYEDLSRCSEIKREYLHLTYNNIPIYRTDDMHDLAIICKGTRI